MGRARGVQLGQLELHVAGTFARQRRAAGPAAVSVQLPGALVVGEGAFERVEQLLPQVGLGDRRRELDAVVEVARHQVGGGDVDGVLAAALERVDARVLEQAPDDRDDPDVLRDPRQPGAQAADARAR